MGCDILCCRARHVKVMDQVLRINVSLSMTFYVFFLGGGVAKNLHFMIFVACKKLGSCKIAISDDTIELFSYFQQ